MCVLYKAYGVAGRQVQCQHSQMLYTLNARTCSVTWAHSRKPLDTMERAQRAPQKNAVAA